MGLFKKVQQVTGDVPDRLLERGLLGRGTVSAMKGNTSRSRSAATPIPRASTRSSSRSRATTRSRFGRAVTRRSTTTPRRRSSRTSPSSRCGWTRQTTARSRSIFARAADRHHAHGGTRSAHDVHDPEQGVPAWVAVSGHQFMGMRNAQGVDMHPIKYTVTRDGKPPYEMQLTQPVPADGIPLLQEGADLPAKVLADNDQTAVVDDAASPSARPGLRPSRPPVPHRGEAGEPERSGADDLEQRGDDRHRLRAPLDERVTERAHCGAKCDAVNARANAKPPAAAITGADSWRRRTSTITAIDTIPAAVPAQKSSLVMLSVPRRKWSALCRTKATAKPIATHRSTRSARGSRSGVRVGAVMAPS